MVYPKMMNHNWLVAYLPLWKIWLRQLGLLFPMWWESHSKFHGSSHQQPENHGIKNMEKIWNIPFRNRVCWWDATYFVLSRRGSAKRPWYIARYITPHGMTISWGKINIHLPLVLTMKHTGYGIWIWLESGVPVGDFWVPQFPKDMFPSFFRSS